MKSDDNRLHGPGYYPKRPGGAPVAPAPVIEPSDFAGRAANVLVIGHFLGEETNGEIDYTEWRGSGTYSVVPGASLTPGWVEAIHIVDEDENVLHVIPIGRVVQPGDRITFGITNPTPPYSTSTFGSPRWHFPTPWLEARVPGR